jgi:hypothetical protein
MPKPYVFGFIPEKGKARIWWTRYGEDMEGTFSLAKKAASKDYPYAGSWIINNPELTGERLPKETGPTA